MTKQYSIHRASGVDRYWLALHVPNHNQTGVLLYTSYMAALKAACLMQLRINKEDWPMCGIGLELTDIEDPLNSIKSQNETDKENSLTIQLTDVSLDLSNTIKVA